MSKKIFAFTIIILLVLSSASPAFAASSHSVSVYYPEPYVDEYAGYFSYTTSSGDIYTYAWTFLPYRSSGELTNSSPFVEVTYSSNSLRFDILPGITNSTNFILYRYFNSASSTSPSLTMMEYVTVVAGTNFTYSSPSPVAVAMQGPVAFNNSENSAYFALDITFSEDSNTNYNIELFYNYYKNMMDMLYPAITAAFADINNIDLSVDNIEVYSSQINSTLSSVLNLLTTELVGSGDGSLQNPYTIRDLLVRILDKSGSEYSDSDLDEIESLLSTISNSDLALIQSLLSSISDVDLASIQSLLTSISDEDLESIRLLLTNITRRLVSVDNSLTDVVNSLTDPSMSDGVLSSLNVLSSHFVDVSNFLSDYSSFASLPELLESTLSVLNSDFYDSFLKDHFERQESFYDSAEAFFEAYASQVVDERLDYNDSQENSLSIFSLFNRVILQPFRGFWSQISAYFSFDSGFQRSDSVITDYLFYSSDLPGFNNLSDVDWSTLP